MIIRRYSWLVLLLLPVLLALACGGESSTDGAGVSTADAQSTADYTPRNPWPLFNDRLGFEIYIDHDFWGPAASRDLGEGWTVVTAVSEDRHHFLRLEIGPRPTGDMAALREERRTTLSQQLPRFQAGATGEGTLAGLAALTLEYRYFDQQMEMQVRSTLAFSDDRAVVLEVGAETGYWPAFQPQAAYLASALKLLPPRSASGEEVKAAAQ